MTLFVDISNQIATFELDVKINFSSGLTAIYGPSGAGKTTVLNAISGLLKPDKGSIVCDDITLFDHVNKINIPSHKRGVGYVFQDARLFPHLNVRRNLCYGAKKAFGLNDVPEMLGISHLLGRYPANLSGGERQRVAIGRALLSEPKILCMDEPLSSLDPARKDEIIPYLKRLKSFTDIPILMVSHEMSDVSRLADRLVVIRDGKLLREGTVSDLLSDPKAIHDIGLHEAGSVLHGKMVGFDEKDQLSTIEIGEQNLTLPGRQGALGLSVGLRIMAQDVIVALDKPNRVSALNVMQASVQSIELGLGPGVAIALDISGQTVLARITRKSLRELQLSVGQKCFAILKATSVAPKNVDLDQG